MPDLDRNEALAWLRLTLVPGVSPARQQELLRGFGSPQQVLASPSSRVASVVGDEVAGRLAHGPDDRLVDATVRWLEGTDHHLLTLGDDDYPRALLEIADPPTVLYAIGRVELLNRPSLAVVGSRNASPQGVRDARELARALSEAGLTIVSGLALGIDAAAHEGGLAAQGSTVAVIGTGADRTYPRANRSLADAIAARGCLLTEFALGTPPLPGNFPRRNRLISGLARGVLVVEAARESGSLGTARCAIDQDRDVFAVPGSIHASLAKGCHRLIKEGAKLVEDAGDVLEELGISVAAAAPAESDCAVRNDKLLDAMGFAPVTIDRIAQLTGEGAAAVAAHLSRLQIEGRVEAVPGGRFQRVGNKH